MSEERVSVLLRLPKALLERADQRRGAMKRNPWLVEVVAAHLDGLDASEVARDPGRAFGSHAHRFRVRDEDGADLGLVASRREDGVLEIGAADVGSGDGEGQRQTPEAPGSEGAQGTVPPASEFPDALEGEGNGGPLAGAAPGVGPVDGEPEGADTGLLPVPATEIGDIP